MSKKPETTCREYFAEYVRAVEGSRFNNLHLGIHMKFTSFMNKIITELEHLKEEVKGWINKSGKSKKQSKRTPVKKKKSLKTSRKPTRKETKSATTVKKCLKPKVKAKVNPKRKNNKPEWKVKIIKGNRNASNKLQRHK